MPSLTVFLDASVILSGLASPTGGSGYLLKAAGAHKFTLCTTPQVIDEVSRHLDKLKLTSRQLQSILDKRLIHLVPNPNPALITRCTRLTPDPDDAHVLAGAITTHTDYLVSLDKKHLLTPVVNKYLSPRQALSPKDFWSHLRSLNQ